MDAKKLIEGLPISIKANAIKANSTDMGLETVRIMAYPTETRTALDVAEAIGWRVLLALMDEQEPGWRVGDEAECDGVHFLVTGVVDLGEFGVKLRGHPHIADVNACACRHFPAPQQPKPDFSGPAWDTVEFYAKQGNAAYRCILILRDYLLSKEKL